MINILHIRIKKVISIVFRNFVTEFICISIYALNIKVITSYEAISDSLAYN